MSHYHPQEVQKKTPNLGITKSKLWVAKDSRLEGSVLFSLILYFKNAESKAQRVDLPQNSKYINTEVKLHQDFPKPMFFKLHHSPLYHLSLSFLFH